MCSIPSPHWNSGPAELEELLTAELIALLENELIALLAKELTAELIALETELDGGTCALAIGLCTKKTPVRMELVNRAMDEVASLLAEGRMMKNGREERKEMDTTFLTEKGNDI